LDHSWSHTKIKKSEPADPSKAAIADAKKHFIDKKHKRGKLIMPCGTGKSFTSMVLRGIQICDLPSHKLLLKIK